MTQFISCDWGTSRFRLRLFDSVQQRMAAEYSTNEGVRNFVGPQFTGNARSQLLDQVFQRGIAALGVSHQPSIPVVVSGMASSTLGWQSLAYSGLPAPIDGSTLHFADFLKAGRKVRLVSGLQAASDVMRGEETELVGLFATAARCQLAEDCIVIMPGSHSKHVQLRSGQIAGFTTFVTGELYALLCQHSILEIPDEIVFDAVAFRAGIQASRSLSLSAALFQTRARTVLGLLPSKHSPSFLSGVLIGAEVATLAEADVKQIILAASTDHSAPYALAVAELLPSTAMLQIPPEELALATALGQAKILSY